MKQDGIKRKEDWATEQAAHRGDQHLAVRRWQMDRAQNDPNRHQASVVFRKGPSLAFSIFLFSPSAYLLKPLFFSSDLGLTQIR